MSFNESSETFGTHRIYNVNYGLAVQLQSTTTLKISKKDIHQHAKKVTLAKCPIIV